jgi:hypothetical protein
LRWSLGISTSVPDIDSTDALIVGIRKRLHFAFMAMGDESNKSQHWRFARSD